MDLLEIHGLPGFVRLAILTGLVLPDECSQGTRLILIPQVELACFSGCP